jgi:hypothetical protein
MEDCPRDIVLPGKHTGNLRGIQMRFEATPPPAEGKFVITLCSVATPITMPQPSPQFTRFRFFLGQTLEANRKRYTLYMGHFHTPAEAEKWLTVLRAIYPDAFVSEGPTMQPGTLSDSQVLSILEERHLSPARDSTRDDWQAIRYKT